MALEWRYTYQGNDNGDPNESLGGSMSATQLKTGLHNLFDAVTPEEAENGDTEYRCLVLYADASHSDIEVYIDPETSSPDTQIDLAWEGKNPASPTTIPDEDSAPDQTGWEETSFTHRNSSNKLALSDMDAGDKQYIWFKRIVNAGANLGTDTATICVEYS